MKWQKAVDGFNRVFWFSGDWDIEKYTRNPDYPYRLGRKSEGYSYYEGDFKTLKAAKDWAQNNQ